MQPQANSPLGLAKELAVVQAFATTEVEGRGLPAKEEVNEFRSAYHYVGAMVNHEFPSLERIREEQHKQKDIKDVIDFLKLSDDEKRAAKPDLAGHYARERDLIPSFAGLGGCRSMALLLPFPYRKSFQ